MKKRILLLATLAGTLVSCNPKQSSMYEPDAWHNAAVDVSETRDRVECALHSENGDIKDFFGADILEYDIPSADSDWQIADSLAFSDQFTAKAISRFNSYLAIHNIFSQWELYSRELECGYQINALSEMENVMGFKPTIAYSSDIRNAIDTAALFTCRQIGSSFFGSQENMNPEILIDDALRLLAVEPLVNTGDELSMDMAIRLQLSWKDSFDKSLVSAMGKCSDQDSCLDMFFHAIQEAPDFDSQCALAMGCIETVPSEFVLPVMQALLESGHYGKYNFIMWLGWRSAMQYFYLGPSRDSRIGDTYFNIQRKNSFLAACDYLKNHPNDFSALLTMEWLCTTSNITRNGSNPYGNESPLDYDMVFGE